MKEPSSTPPGNDTPSTGYGVVFWFATILVAAYFVIFLAVPFEPYRDLGGDETGRWSFLSYLLLPDEYFAAWTGPAGAVSILDRIPILLTTIACLFAAHGWGTSILQALRFSSPKEPETSVSGFPSPLEHSVFSTVIGLSCFSILFFWFGFFGKFPNGFFAWILVAVCSFWPFCRMSCGDQTPNGVRRLKVEIKSFSILHYSFTILFVLLLLLGGMIPSTDYDVLSYHLAGAREFAQSGRIEFLPHNVYANMPFGAEMFVVWGITLTGDALTGAMIGKTIIATTTILTALGVYAFGRRFFSESAGSIGMLLYLTTPWIVYVSTAGLIDSVVGMYAFFAIYAVFLTKRAPDVIPGATGNLFLTGFLAGSAAACKYPAMLFVVLPIAVLLILPKESAMKAAKNDYCRRNFRVDISNFFLFSSAVLLACGGWYFKNWYFTGNPVYPLCFSIFGDSTGSWNAAVDARWVSAHAPHGFGLTTFFGDCRRVLLSSPWNAPLTIPLSLLAMFGLRKMERPARTTFFLLLAWVAFVFACWWFLTHRLDRFWLPVVPVLSLLAGVGAGAITGNVWRRTLTAFLIVASLYCFLVSGAAAPGKTNFHLASLRAIREDPNISTPWAVWFNAHPPEGRILMVGEAKAFLYDVPVLYATCWNETPLKKILSQRAPDVGPKTPRAAFQQQNISYILVDWGEIRRFRSPGNYGFSDFVTPELFDRLVAEGILERYCPTEELEKTSTVVYRVLTK